MGYRIPGDRAGASAPDPQGRFMAIEQALGTPVGREAAWRDLCEFIET